MLGQKRQEPLEVSVGQSPTSDVIKRVAGVAIAGLGLVVSLPFWVVISPAIMAEDGWPVLYSQPRVGRGGRTFRVHKFRSMAKDAEKLTGATLATKDDPRITRVGRILRKTAVDEIPQLVNIFIGDMGWVGPRPERPEFVERLAEEIPGYQQRHQVRPGLTGMAQVYGRYHTPASEKLKLDLEYISRRGLLLDARLSATSWLITLTGRWDSTEETR